MKRRSRAASVADAPAGVLGTVDEKGRIALAKPFRQALGLHAGSAVAQVLLQGAVVLVPQDEHLAVLARGAEEALAAGDLTVQDILDELPAARAAVVEEAYGPAFLAEIARLQRAGRRTRRR
jgi:hypothetical protein